MRSPARPFRKPHRLFVLAIGLPLVVAGAGVASAASPGGQSVARGPATPQDAAHVSSVCGALAGTVVVDGGRSFAFFGSGPSPRLVKEGDEVVAGVRLVRVGADGVVVEHAGAEIPIPLKGHAGGSTATALRQEPRGATPTVSQVTVAREVGWLQARNADLIKARLQARQQRWKALRGTPAATAPAAQGRDLSPVH